MARQALFVRLFVRLLEVLDQYKPVVWEYSRLNITNMVMSKRKLNKLVTQHYVNGWWAFP